MKFAPMLKFTYKNLNKSGRKKKRGYTSKFAVVVIRTNYVLNIRNDGQTRIDLYVSYLSM